MPNTTTNWDKIKAHKKMQCANCSGWMHKGKTSKPEGEAICLKCRQETHGTPGKYKNGCRCEVCRKGVAERSKSYNAKVKARDGVSKTAQFKRKAKGHDPISGPSLPVCIHCGDPLKHNSRSSAPRHKGCERQRKTPIFIGPQPEQISPKRAKALKAMETAAQGSAGRTPWTNGICSECQLPYTGKQPSLTCSSRCAKLRVKRLHKVDKFNIPRSRRTAIFERDKWECQICNTPVDKDAHPSNDWYPSLDHIIPRSTQLVPDHSDENLRCAHRVCNSMRGDGTKSSDQQIKARIVSRRILIAA